MIYKNYTVPETITDLFIHLSKVLNVYNLNIADFDYTGNKEHILLDIHRPENFKYEDRLRAIIDYGNYCCDRTNTPVKLLHFSRTLSYIKKFNIDRKKVMVIPNPADSSYFLPKREKLDNPFTFLSIALLRPEKRLDLLIKAFAKLHKNIHNIAYLGH